MKASAAALRTAPALLFPNQVISEIQEYDDRFLALFLAIDPFDWSIDYSICRVGEKRQGSLALATQRIGSHSGANRSSAVKPNVSLVALFRHGRGQPFRMRFSPLTHSGQR